jgi:caffeoyl-CoA O-methyltransferase
MNKHLIAKEIQDYCEHFSDAEHDYLHQLMRETYLTHAQPHMLSGQLQGRFLSIISQLLNPQFILEIGTYTGYSALCLAEGLQADGELITIDVDAEKEMICNKYFQLSPYGPQIKMIVGDALKIIPTLSQTFDLVFIDADKINYSNYFSLVINQLKIGGCILVDNVLFNGDVIADKKSKNAEAVHQFNMLVKNDDRVQKVIIPIRDGITLMRKIKD